MSNTKHPVTSGFDDVDIVLSNVNKKEELQDENEKLDARMEQVNGSLYRAEEALKRAEAIITRIETVTASLTKSTDKIEPALNAMADNMSKDKRFKFTTQLDDKSIQSIKAQHEEFVKEEKKLLSEHREALKKSMSESVAEEKKAFENHKIEMERTKQYGEGVWFSKRAWDWIFGFMIVSGFWFVASLTVLIIAFVD